MNEDFKPENIGWEFDPQGNLFGMITHLLSEFSSRFSYPLTEVAYGIALDGPGYYQLRGELSKMTPVPSSTTVDSIKGITIRGLPIVLSAVPAVVLLIKPAFAPKVLHDQLRYGSEGFELKLKEEAKAPDAPPDKSEMH